MTRLTLFLLIILISNFYSVAFAQVIGKGTDQEIDPFISEEEYFNDFGCWENRSASGQAYTEGGYNECILDDPTIRPGKCAKGTGEYVINPIIDQDTLHGSLCTVKFMCCPDDRGAYNQGRYCGELCQKKYGDDEDEYASCIESCCSAGTDDGSFIDPIDEFNWISMCFNASETVSF